MYPFFLLKLPLEATDDDVDRRYHELIQQYPPDRDPEQFPLICQAHESLKDQRARLRARLFYFDDTGRAITESSPGRLREDRRHRIPPGGLAALLCTTRETPVR